jgi:hypothetical protein
MVLIEDVERFSCAINGTELSTELSLELWS